MRRLILAFAGICLSLILLAGTVAASQVVAVNVSDLITKSNVAFTGTCTAKDAKLQDGLLVTTYTFDVKPEAVLKGTVSNPFSFTQWGAPREDAARLHRPVPPGIPTYDVGKEYTLFLTAPSTKGLSSPLGLGQGKFTTVVGADGKKQVVNDYGNKSLFTNLPATKGMSKALTVGGVEQGKSPAGGPMDLETFQKMMRQINEQSPRKE